MSPYEKLALILSLSSLGVSVFVLGWNVYRDVVLKARVRVRLQLSFVAHGSYRSPTKISIAATNLGPGKIICSGIYAKVAPFWRRLLRKTKYAYIMWDYTNPYSSELPHELNAGEVCTLFLSFGKDCLLAEPFTHVGISDTFNRIHWAPRRDVARAREEYRRRFCVTQSDRRQDDEDDAPEVTEAAEPEPKDMKVVR